MPNKIVAQGLLHQTASVCFTYFKVIANWSVNELQISSYINELPYREPNKWIRHQEVPFDAELERKRRALVMMKWNDKYRASQAKAANTIWERTYKSDGALSELDCANGDQAVNESMWPLQPSSLQDSDSSRSSLLKMDSPNKSCLKDSPSVAGKRVSFSQNVKVITI
ncbi:hypothetical protein BC830DRAFT_733213 [Chytriomyces sp. MP71]|nr:hypothetical protein BC830DRAFT_733213 [Chytriomyces sp. MP71]